MNQWQNSGTMFIFKALCIYRTRMKGHRINNFFLFSQCKPKAIKQDAGRSYQHYAIPGVCSKLFMADCFGDITPRNIWVPLNCFT